MSITFDSIARYEVLVALLITLLAVGFRVYERAALTRIEEVVARIAAGWRGPFITVALALLLRGGLMWFVASPQPQVHDEFSYLLMGDTFAHFRVTNPTPPSWQHFETFHENMVPTYHSKYPIAQGVALAVGQVLGGDPWIGVYLSTALMAGAICWALQAFVPPGWALFGGVLCVLRFCVLGYWMNSYWGGSIAAMGGALVLGAAARLLVAESEAKPLMYEVFSAGLMTVFFSRPLEGFLFCAPLVALVFWRTVRGGGVVRSVLPMAAVVLPGLWFFFYYNLRTTGNPTLMPYLLYERTYASTPLFVMTANSHLPQYRHAAMADYYQRWLTHAALYSSPANFLGFEKVRFALCWNFYAGWILSIPIVVGAWKLSRRSLGRAVLGGVMLSLVVYALVLAFHPHYVATMTSAIFVLAVVGLRTMWGHRSPWVRCLALGSAVAAIVFAVREPVSTIYMFRSVRTRQTVSALLGRNPGQHLVLVKFLPGHVSDTDVVFNGAELASEKILWARKMSTAQDVELCQAFPGRMFWDLETDDKSVSLKPSALCEGSR